MTKKREKMVCPDCGALMNYHADKIDYSVALDDAEAIDDDFGGIVEEVHTCPACGHTHMRRADSERRGES